MGSSRTSAIAGSTLENSEMSMIRDDDILLYPERIWPEKKAMVLDGVSYALPILAATLGVGGGIAALDAANQWAASLTILSAVASAGGVLVMGLTSRNRDRKVAAAHAVGWLGVQTADRNTDHSNFG